MTETIESRFWSKVNKLSPEECWPWIGAKSSWGYGNFRFRKKPWPAHRVVWVLNHGEIPKGMYICHKCDNPPCCNPDHLFMGTPKENTADMFNKGYNHNHLRGSNHPLARFNENEILEIKKLLHHGVKQTHIARMFNTRQSHISKIKRNEIWGYLVLPPT